MSKIDSAKIQAAEKQIESERKTVDYDTREFTIEFLVEVKYLKGEETDSNDLYVPEYQREFVWDDFRQSRFIESIILGLPIPLVFVAEIPTEGRLEIVDGSQRIRTLAAFLNNELRLRGLSKLTHLNGFCFEDFSPSRQRLFRNTPMRMIVLSSKATEEVRNDMFDRINTSSLPLCPMEKRKGIYRGKFSDFVYECSKDKLFVKLCPIDLHFKDRQEEAELILRFFAFSDTYPKFSIPKSIDLERGVERFLDKYLEQKNSNVTEKEMREKKADLTRVLEFVEKTFPYGFGKYKNSRGTSRPYFESISIGSLFAINENPKLTPTGVQWANLDRKSPNEFYLILSGRYHTHKPQKLRERIEYVQNKLLGK